MIYFISGGVRSGKSNFAERMALEIAKNRKVYLATSIPYDDEMKQRVQNHQNWRKKDGWITIEQPCNISQIVNLLEKDDMVLIDCLTLLVSNEMFDEKGNMTEDVTEKVYEELMEVYKCVKHLVIVSNDIFQDSIQHSQKTKYYIKNLGILHQRIVAIADEAYEAVSGLQIMRKGEQI